MSFNAKNLTYESKDPAFLRRLKSEYGGRDSVRHEHPLPRPKKQNSRDDEDDEPVYLDGETQNPISKNEYETLISHENKLGSDQGLPPSLRSSSSQVDSPLTDNTKALNGTVLSKQQEASIGGNPRKRPAKVIGDDHKAAENTQKIDDTSKNRESIFRTRKPKKVKLCFDEDIES